MRRRKPNSRKPKERSPEAFELNPRNFVMVLALKPSGRLLMGGDGSIPKKDYPDMLRDMADKIEAGLLPIIAQSKDS